MSHTTWGADKTTLLCLYLVLVHFKLDYRVHVYCTASPHTLCILDPVKNEGLRLATGAFLSSPIARVHVESNVLPLDLHRESLAVKALLHPYFLPSSPGYGQFLLEICFYGSPLIASGIVGSEGSSSSLSSSLLSFTVFVGF